MKDPRQIIRDLVAVATGQVAHVYLGSCPDQLEGNDARDHDCPACRAIMTAERLLENDHAEISRLREEIERAAVACSHGESRTAQEILLSALGEQ